VSWIVKQTIKKRSVNHTERKKLAVVSSWRLEETAETRRRAISTKGASQTHPAVSFSAYLEGVTDTTEVWMGTNDYQPKQPPGRQQ